MSRWKLLVPVPFLMLPLAYAGIATGAGIEHRESRATVVLPSEVVAPQVTLRPRDSATDPGSPSPGKSGPRPGQDELDCDQDDQDDTDDTDDAEDTEDTGDTDDDDRDDDRDDQVEIVQPCPDVVGDDDDDDDDGEGDGDDAADD